MQRRPIIIDCDPGIDDAIMLFLAFAAPDEFDILGITTVAGNVPVELNSRNACMIRELAGREDVPVFMGSPRPMARDLETAEHVHGETGMLGVEPFETRRGVEDKNAIAFLVDTLMVHETPVTLVPTGPLTNIALAIEMEPRILPKIEQIVVMGGAMREGGNVTPSAEFNIYADPHAADIVLRCGRPIVMMGLDVTHQAMCTEARLAQICPENTIIAKAVKGLLTGSIAMNSQHYGVSGAPLHDPCTIAYLLKPDLFETKLCNVAVETQSSLTLGHTAVDFWGVSGRAPNVNWVHTLDVGGFFELLTERLARL